VNVASHLRRYVIPRLWFMPVVGVVAAVLVSVVTLTLDRRLTDIAIPVFGAAPAQIASVFAVIATSILNLLALVFTILIVVLQLTSSQYSHRALRTLLQDTQSRVTLGIFVATYMHALIVLAALGTAPGDTRVAGFSVLSTFTLAIVSIGAFLLLIDHITQAIRATSIIAAIGKEARELMERVYPEPLEEGPEADSSGEPDERPDGVVHAPRSGILNRIDAERLIAAACQSECELRVLPALGDFVPAGTPLIAIHGGNGTLDDVEEYVELGPDRLMEQDVGFGIRQLVDIAERALSPGTNDPTIAVHAIDQIHDLLRILATRRLATGAHRDASGAPRLYVRARRWEDYVALAIDEIRHCGGRSIQVARRLRALLEDVAEVAPPERQPPLERQQALLDASIARHFEDDPDRELARRPDPQGHGFSESRFAPEVHDGRRPAVRLPVDRR
jgi:uncharacterized membrane protein